MPACSIRLDNAGVLGEFMYQKMDDSPGSLAVMANLQNQDAEFRRRLLFAIEQGDEHCPIRVNTSPGTKRPIHGYRPD